jgi:hypothetical protein
MKNWRSVFKAIVAFGGSLVTAIGTVAATKQGEPFTNADWFIVLAIVLGVGGTTGLVWKVENEPNQNQTTNRAPEESHP